MLHSWHAIEPWSFFLDEAMPMEGGPFFRTGDLIVECNLDGVPPIRLKHWPWKLPINEDAILLVSVRSNDAALQSEMIASDYSSVGHVIGVASFSSERTPGESGRKWVVGEERREFRRLQCSPQ